MRHFAHFLQGAFATIGFMVFVLGLLGIFGIGDFRLTFGPVGSAEKQCRALA